MARARRFFLFLLAAAALVAAPLPALAKLDEKAYQKAQRDLESAIATGSPDMIAPAVEAVAADQSKRAVELLVRIGAQLDDISQIPPESKYQVYESVKKGLATMSEPEAVSAMIAELKKTDPKLWQLRCVLVECMASVKGDGVTAAVAGALNDKVPYVISAAAKSLGARKDKDGVAPLITKLKELEKHKDIVWVDVKQALTDITGQDLADAKEWESFWQARGGSFDPEKDRGDKTESTTVIRAGEESGEFFKEKILAKRIMFVIDVSGSMNEQDIPMEGKGTQSRIQVVKDELIRCLQRLKGDVRFNIISFSQDAKFWMPLRNGQSALTPAGEGAKADAIKWVSSLKADGGTESEMALKKAFEAIEVNQIVFLSDGAPTKGQGLADTRALLDVIKGLNRLRGVKINTFCFAVFQRMGGAEPLLQFMEDLAKQNGGKMTLVGGGGKKPAPPPGN
ncbi:MAG TPA: VWA domain-containing protein [Planctomycetota bacterium]|nr:VWA domain-containing protein [Planctomycetota bacterium]